jgi:D-glycero-beta-D-manno-heptose-7-phosphate kinase
MTRVNTACHPKPGATPVEFAMTKNLAARERYLEIIQQFRGCPIAVYGDLVADEFVYGEISRVSREAPVLILNYRESFIVPGGAANAINNLHALGARPVPLGILGNDEAGKALRRQFLRSKIPLSQVRAVKGYMTPTKSRYSAGSAHSARQQVLRIDRGCPFVHSADSAEATRSELAGLVKECKGVLVSDYGFGFVSPEVVARVASRRQSAPVTVDSRFSLLQHRGVTACTPNESEVEQALGIKIGSDTRKLEEAGAKLLRQLQVEAVLITRGRDGMALFVAGQKPVHIPIFGTDEIADVTGAGDTVIAVFTLALAVGASFLEAARLSNYAGGIVVMKRGTATLSAQELQQAVMQG